MSPSISARPMVTSPKMSWKPGRGRGFQNSASASASVLMAKRQGVLRLGPGTISAQGAKGAVSADGPEQPDRVQLNKALIGFLTHSGYAHGGNGYEGIAFLLDQFADSPAGAYLNVGSIR